MFVILLRSPRRSEFSLYTVRTLRSAVGVLMINSGKLIYILLLLRTSIQKSIFVSLKICEKYSYIYEKK